MENNSLRSRLWRFSTCPQSKDVDATSYVRCVAEVAQWSEQYGCEEILVYADNSIADPWLVADVILQHTQRLYPLIAVQPVYMHPYSVAKMIATQGYMYQRKLYLNMVAGVKSSQLACSSSCLKEMPTSEWSKM